MIYKYRKFSVLIQILICVLFDIALICYAYHLDGNGNFYKKILFAIPCITFIILANYIWEPLNRSVELSQSYVKFNFFRLKDVRMRNARSFSINYENILSIESKKLPFSGIYGIKISARNLPQKLSINFNFCNHKELYSNLCFLAKQHNPNVYIDNKLQDYIKKL